MAMSVCSDCTSVPRCFAMGSECRTSSRTTCTTSPSFRATSRRRTASGRWTSTGAPPPDAWPRCWAIRDSNRTSSYAPSGSHVRPRWTSRSCRARRVRSSRPTPMASTSSLSSTVRACRSSSSSSDTSPSRGPRSTPSHCRSSSSTTQRATTRRSCCGRASPSTWGSTRFPRSCPTRE